MNDINKYEKDFSYPLPSDLDFITKIYKKREFYYHRAPKREKMKNYREIKNFRSSICKVDKKPTEQQYILPNFINLNTPYKGILLMHGVGTGKTMTAIRIAEQFIDQIKKYNTKIYVIVPGPNTRENFKKELIYSTGNTYLKNIELLEQMSKEDINKEKKTALFTALQNYKILSYKGFYKKVLGEKIVEKKIVNNNKIKSSYRKNIDGDFEREIVIDKISNMDNTIIIVDEAHNITDNEYGEALKKIIKNSENLRVILLTATPMINSPDEIVDLLNFIKPLNDQIERDKIFTNDKSYNIQIKSDGIEYLKNKARGFISYYRGAIPYTYAKRVEKGTIPDNMLFTPLIRCYMSDFQYAAYKEQNKSINDNNDKNNFLFSSSNFVFPGLNKDKTDIIGLSSTEGLNNILSQIKSDGAKLRELINTKILNNSVTKEMENNIIFESEKKNISGLILKLPYLQFFSIKFFKLIKRLEKLVEGKKGTSTAFVYSNLVKTGGIELFAETLLQNGYLEYEENNNNYNIQDTTIDYKTGLPYSEFINKYNKSNFKPAVFLLITGANEEGSDELPEVKQKIVQDIFNNYNNTDGKYIKFILGSRVMNEGVTLKNCKEVHILDPFFNIPKAEQVIGRAIRACVHQDVISNNYKFPRVYIYRYVVSISDKEPNKLSIDENLYQKAEFKYLTVKKIERSLKEVAIDCPLLLHSNMFPEELEKYKDCVEPTLENIKENKKICPAICDFKTCELKCDVTLDTNKKLNYNEIDFNTFNDDIAKYEINIIKNNIKDLYKFKYIYLYNEILDLIKTELKDHQIDLFNNYFLNKALHELMPKTQNDFNNFKDVVYDKYNKPGYIIKRGIYYIFQPINENENVPMYYRKQTELTNKNQVSLNNYIKYNHNVKKYDNNDVIDEKQDKINYDFNSTLDYYNNRDENFIVGIIDKNLNKLAYEDIDLFKIREKTNKKEEKKRGVGIPTFKGAVCFTSKDKKYLLKLYKNITKSEINNINKLSKTELCTEIKNRLLYLEKYSTSEDKNKMTYVMIPFNHPLYPFPYNLEDRIKYIIKQLYKISGRNIDVLVKKNTNNKQFIKYHLSFNNINYLDNYKQDFIKLQFKLIDNKWELEIN